MAALLASTPASYVDPRASILYGGGNSKITDDEIRAYIKTPGVTDQDVMAKALANNVSANQVSKAMMDNPAYAQPNVDKFLTGQGITKEQTPAQYNVPEAAAAPAPVTFKPISIGTNDTVQGQLGSILSDPNNPLMVQASTAGKQYANKRGMLDSSIGAGAAESAMISAATPIAQQDASTNFSAKQQNSQGALTADTFNADTQSRTNMFNTGAAKDIYTANMDTNNKLAIANIQAMANDSSIMGDLGKAGLAAYTQIVSDPNMTPDVKTASINKIDEYVKGYTSLLSSIEMRSKGLTFGKVADTAGAAASGGTVAGTAPTDSSKYPAASANTLGYQLEPAVLGQVANYERATGEKIDRSKVAPEAMVMDFRVMSYSPLSGVSYLASDGMTKMTTPSTAYDTTELMKKYGVRYPAELFDKMFVAVHPPGTMRADNPMFYVYR